MSVGLASSKKRALVTGASGFTGKYLVQELMGAGYEVFGTFPENEMAPTGSYFPLDFCSQVAVKRLIWDIKPNIVAHLAAVSFVPENDTSSIYETNFLGSFYLLEALGRLHPDSLDAVLLCSSAHIYGNNSKEILNEETMPDPVNEYAVSKFAMEKMAKLWMNRLPIFIVRPFNYTGVGQSEKFLVPKIVSHFKEKKPTIELGNLDVWREFGDVRFVVKTYRKLLDLCPSGQTLNICTGVTHSLSEVTRMCQEITGHQINVEINPRFIRTNEVRRLQGDNSRLKEIIKDWEIPNLKDTLKWMLNESQ